MFPIPHTWDLINSLAGSKVFSSLDLRSGYWQLAMHPDSVEKTAFRTTTGHYKWLVMPMGLTNAPSLFQRVMTHIFEGLPFVKVYMDDLLVHSTDRSQHV